MIQRTRRDDIKTISTAKDNWGLWPSEYFTETTRAFEIWTTDTPDGQPKRIRRIPKDRVMNIQKKDKTK